MNVDDSVPRDNLIHTEVMLSKPRDTLVIMGDSVDRRAINTLSKELKLRCKQVSKGIPQRRQRKPRRLSAVWNVKACTSPTLFVLVITQAWGYAPYGAVHWIAPYPNGYETAIPGVDDELSRRLTYTWLKTIPDIQRLSKDTLRNIVVIWTVNLWHIASMNVRSSTGLWRAGLGRSYELECAHNMTVHMHTLTRILGSNRVRHAVRLTEEKHTWMNPNGRWGGAIQNVHIRSNNRALELAARRNKATIIDLRNESEGLSASQVLHDDPHPRAWLLKKYGNAYLDLL